MLTGSGDDLATLTPLVNVPGQPLAHPLLLQTNGTTNGSQSKFNLVNGTGTSISDNGSGNVSINVPGLSFKTNGTNLSGSGGISFVDGPDIVPFDQGSGSLSFIFGQTPGPGLIIRRFSLALNSTQIQNLKASPQVFVAHDPLAPNNIYFPLIALPQYHHGTVSYTNTGTSDLKITFRATDSAGGMVFDSNTILNQAGDVGQLRWDENNNGSPSDSAVHDHRNHR